MSERVLKSSSIVRVSDVLRGKQRWAIETGDCLPLTMALPQESVDVVFADPPFNIGLDYPEYDDDRPADEYLEWLNVRLAPCVWALKPSGSMWVSIGPHYQAEVLVMLKSLDLHWRNTVIWHYSFGPRQRKKFTPSWTAMHYLTKSPDQFYFDWEAVSVPSARQLVYNDKRANSKGKTPDDVWVLRPQEAEGLGLFDPSSDVWHVPRVCGTFKERQGHVCQMPLPVLERIVLACTKPLNVVLDPMCGTGTTLAAAVKHGRRAIGFELCEETANSARERLTKG